MEVTSNSNLGSESTIIDGKDSLLEHLIKFANTDALNIGITIFVNGIIVSGTLISSKRYFDGIIHQIYQSNNNTTTSDERDPKEAIKETFSFMEDIRSKLDRKSIDQISAEEVNYIHLEDAKFYQSGLPITSEDGLFWRGKISSIDGFIFGTFVEL
jgi:hypothetical protein